MANYVGDILNIASNLFAPKPVAPMPVTATGNVMPPLPGPMPPVIQDVFSPVPQFNGMPGLPSPNQGMTPYPTRPSSPLPAAGSGQSFDLFQNSVRNPPEWKNPSLARILGTGLYSSIRSEPDQITETINKDGERSYVIRKGNKWHPLNIEEADAILNMPNRRAIEDWKMRSGALEKGVDAELKAANYRSLEEQRRGNLDLGRQREDRLMRTAEGRMELDKMKYDLQDWLARNPRGRVVMPRGGNVTVINPITGEATDTGIPVGLMGEQERIKLEQEGRLDIVNIQQEGATARNNASISAANARNQASIDAANARNTEDNTTAITMRGMPNPSAGVNSQLPTQQKQYLQNRVAQLHIEHPEWRQWLTINPETNLPQITQPKDPNAYFATGPDKATYLQIRDALYGPAQMPAPLVGGYGYNTGAPTGQSVTKTTEVLKGPPSQKLAVPAGTPVYAKGPDGKQWVSVDSGITWKPYSPGSKK